MFEEVMKKELKILDRIETIRRKAEKNPEVYSTDFTVRVIEKIIAEAAGYKNRVEWTNELKKCDSEYKEWIDSEYEKLIDNYQSECE